MKHALIINHNAGSPYHGPNFRSYYAAKGWVARGISSTIVCSSFSHKLSRFPDVNGEQLIEEIDGIRYIWLKTRPFSGNIGRLRNYLEFANKLRNLERIVPEPVDFVVCSSPPPFWIRASQAFARQKEASLIFEARDLWPDVIFETSRTGRLNPAAWLMRAAELKAYREADAVVSVNESAIKVMGPRGLTEDRFRAIPNGTEMSNAPAAKEAVPAIETCRDLKKRGWTLVGYSGALSPVYGLSYLVEAAREMAGEKVAFVLAGTGPYEAELKVAASELSHVHLPGWIPKESLQDFLGEMDICYAGLLDVPSFAYGSDSTKLYEYMKACRPVLHAHGDEDSVVVKAACGERVIPESGRAIAEGIRKLVALGKDERDRLGLVGRDYVQANRSYDVLTDKWLELFDTLAAGKQAPGR